MRDGLREAAALSPARRIIIAAFFMDLAVAMVGLSVQFSGHALDATPTMLGLLATVSAAAYTLLCLFTGRLSDRSGRRTLATLSCLLCAAVWLAMPLARRVWHLLALMPLSGAAIAMFWPATQAWLSEVTRGGPRGLAASLGEFNISWTAGLMLGPPLAGLMWAFGRPAPFLLAAAGVLAVLALLRTVSGAPQAASEAQVGAERGGAGDRLAQHYLHLAWIANFASWFSRGLASVVFPKLGKEIGFSEQLIGLVFAALLAGQLVMFGLLHRRTGWQYRLWPLLAAEAIGAAGMIVAFAARTPGVFAAGFALSGACAGVTYVSSLFYSLHGHPAGRGARSGIHEAVLGSGMLLGPLLGGLVGDLDLRAPFALAALVFVLVAAADLLVWRRTVWPERSRLRMTAEVAGQ